MTKVVFLAITYFLFPETRGHSLEEIAEVFDGPRAIDVEASTEKINKAFAEEHSEERIDRVPL